MRKTASPLRENGGDFALLAERFGEHDPALAGLRPAPLVLFVETAQRIEIEELLPRLDRRAGKDRDPGGRIIAFVRVCVALAAAAHCIHHKRRRIKPSGMSADVLFNREAGGKRSSQIL